MVECTLDMKKKTEKGKPREKTAAQGLARSVLPREFLPFESRTTDLAKEGLRVV